MADSRHAPARVRVDRHESDSAIPRVHLRGCRGARGSRPSVRRGAGRALRPQPRAGPASDVRRRPCRPGEGDSATVFVRAPTERASDHAVAAQDAARAGARSGSVRALPDLPRLGPSPARLPRDRPGDVVARRSGGGGGSRLRRVLRQGGGEAGAPPPGCRDGAHRGAAPAARARAVRSGP